VNVRGFAIDCGHYLAEEAPEATAKALREFFA
jgi:pimeloyl-ACP methyl ester carboxylesterase